MDLEAIERQNELDNLHNRKHSRFVRGVGAVLACGHHRQQMVVGHRLGLLGVLDRTIHAVYGNLYRHNRRSSQSLRQA